MADPIRERPQPPEPAPAGATVLVVDDAEGGREALAILLSEEGYRTLTAADGSAALEALAAEAVDLVLLDVSMPGMGGMQLLDHLRRSRTAVELPVIMVTAADESSSVIDALGRGANDYVTKPLDVPVLLARVRAQLELCRLSRLKDEFLRVASHDLKNPLTAILGAADALGSDFPVGATVTEEARFYIDALRRRAQQMRRMITDFLDLGALQEGRLRLDLAPIDLARLAAQSVDDNAGYAKRKRIALTVVADGARPVSGDAARLQQVIDNLVGNAIKFSPSGGRVTVVVAGARLEVRDTGPGIPVADLGKLFVRHARLHNRPTGGESSTGIGLSLCKQLVELHGGRIGAKNLEEGGALFWFELPV